MAQNWRTLNIQICSRENHSGNAVFNIKTSLATPGLQAKDQNRKISITFCYGIPPHLISHVLGKLLSDRKMSDGPRYTTKSYANLMCVARVFIPQTLTGKVVMMSSAGH